MAPICKEVMVLVWIKPEETFISIPRPEQLAYGEPIIMNIVGLTDDIHSVKYTLCGDVNDYDLAKFEWKPNNTIFGGGYYKCKTIELDLYEDIRALMLLHGSVYCEEN